MAEETKQTPKEEFIKCPCCGELTLRKPLDIKSRVLDEYMASIITGVPFSHTYTVYDSIDITIEVPLKQQARFIMSTLQKLGKIISKAASSGDMDTAEKLKSASGLIQTYHTVNSIVTHSKDKRIVKTYAPAEAVKAFCAAVNDIPEDNLALLLEAFAECDTPDNLSTVPDLMVRAIAKTHNDIYTILLDTGFNENFWKGIELV